MNAHEACNTLIIEDDPASADFIARALTRKGCRHEIVGTAGSALIKLEDDNPPNTLILDLRLPDAIGTLVLRRVRRDNRTVKVAVVTGVSDLSQYPDLLRYPPDAIFSKPIDLTKLMKWMQSNCQC